MPLCALISCAAADAVLEYFGDTARHSDFKIIAWDRVPTINRMSIGIKFFDGRTMHWHEHAGMSEDVSWDDARAMMPGLLGAATIIK
jgi:hypothetical protein